jgi:hypothetical protein
MNKPETPTEATQMTIHQREVLDWFYQNHIGATLFEGKWMWPTDIRNDKNLADRFWQEIDREARVTFNAARLQQLITET